MKTITHRLEIQTTAEQLWRLTIGIERWPTLFPTVTSVTRVDDGPMRAGSSARIKQPGQPVRLWTVTEFEPPRRFVWETQGFGLRMRAIHTIAPVRNGLVTNTLTIEIDGPFGAAVAALAGRKIQGVLALENDGFRAAAESVAAETSGAAAALRGVVRAASLTPAKRHGRRTPPDLFVSSHRHRL